MKNLAVVHVLHGQTDLHEPINNGLLGQQLSPPLFENVVQVALRAPFHHNAKLAIVDETLVTRHNVRVLERLKDLDRKNKG